MESSTSVAIVGAGLVGCLTALALARRGCRVTLIEGSDTLLSRASRFNEGKIHLGFTYGLDRTGETQARMFAYGATFEKSLSDLLSTSLDGLFLHRRCVYAVLRDCLLPDDAIAQHMAGITRLHEEFVASGGATPAPDGPLVDRLDKAALEELFSAQIVAAYEVGEPIIDCERLRDLVRDAVRSEPGIACITGMAIHAIEDGRRPSIVGRNGERFNGFDRVINAAWDGLPAIEKNSGRPASGHCLRAKTGFVADIVRGALPHPVSFVWGMYGDIVPWSDGQAYLSWYPSCRMGFSTDISAGSAWFDAIKETFDFESAYAESRRAFAAFVPGLAFADRPVETRAGAILAHASTDLQDPASGLHQRTKFGVSRFGSIQTVNTGKLSCAPALALELAGSI